MAVGVLVAGGFAGPMMRKLYTPLNFGAFELDHRLVIDGGAVRHLSKPTRAPNLGQGGHLAGGLVIHDTDFFRVAGTLPWASGPAQSVNRQRAPRPTGRFSSSRATVARIDAGFPVRFEDRMTGITGFNRDCIRQIIDAYVDAAVLARAATFDGIEINGCAGTLIDSFLLDQTNGRWDDYGRSPAGRLTFLTELVEAVSHAIGPDRLGIRLSPFRAHNGELRDDIFEEALRTLNGQEVAYLHLVAPRNFQVHGVSGRPLSGAANAARRAFSGIIVSSGNPSVADACNLVDSRWADAVCLHATNVERTLAGERILAQAGPRSAQVRSAETL